MGKYTCFSGAANGADTVFELVGMKYGVKVVAFTFAGHHTISENTKILHQDQLNVADEKLKKVNKVLKRTFPTDKLYINNLLRRDYYQCENADAIFAVAEIEDNLVKGGTAWATHMAILDGKPVYVFEQNLGKWFTWKDDSFVECEEPILTEKFAGIGTREINTAGVKAIKSIYKKTFKPEPNE